MPASSVRSYRCTNVRVWGLHPKSYQQLLANLVDSLLSLTFLLFRRLNGPVKTRRSLIVLSQYGNGRA